MAVRRLYLTYSMDVVLMGRKGLPGSASARER